jgi:HD-GYP domain-containing protein (c-di-GMP phosphodiesterase class II)
MIEQIRLFRAEEPIVYHHHEWFDGTGYPDGLKGDKIPLGARIIAVADAYDAMTSIRPYRKAMDVTVTQNIIKESSGTQFDPKIAEVFLRTM